MTEDVKNQVLKANANFYKAVLTCDVGLIEDVWLKDARAKCVHPGWPMLYGWESIKESWKAIFNSGAPTDIALSDVKVEVSGRIAWVVCIEEVSHKVGEEIQTGFAQATNLYELSDSSWHLALHHACPIPIPLSEFESSKRLQ